ncbi:TPA: gp53-like domain-containing protein [Escherichia coli]
MHRIDTKTAQKDKFGAGKNGFTRGNPQTGTPATDLDDDYFDMLQEELCSVVEASGASLEKGRNDQLLTALRALLLSRKNPFGDIKSDGTVKTALENLGLGEAAKRNVGNGQNQIPDMAAFASSLSSTGFQKLPSGLIIQWGIVSGASNYTVTYPVTFPNRSLALLAVPHTTSVAGISAMGIANCSDISKSQFYIIVGGISQGEVVKYERSCFWVAIGV